MAAIDVPVTTWEITIDGEKQYGAYGSRDILFIVSDDHLRGLDIVPRRDVKLTEDDWDELKTLDLPPQFENWDDDASIMWARYATSPGYNDHDCVVGAIRSKSERKLSKSNVLRRIKELMNTSDKEGVMVSYFGPGKRNTGDWCFEDGFITFRDLAELYCNHFKGRVLTINTDCSYSDQWVKELGKFLDEQGVKPCGHSAREKGILMKVRASCKPTEIPYRLLYSVRAYFNDKNTGRTLIRPSGFEVAKEQHIYRVDSTWLSCSAPSFEEPCTFSPEYTWERREATYRVMLVRGAEQGQPAWQYVILHDDEEKIKEFKERTMGANAGKNTVNPSKYGTVVKSGQGKDPPNDFKEWMKNNYGGS